MWVFAVLGLVLSAAAWRLTGLRGLGRGLVRALGSPNENLRTIAAMLLVKAGSRSEPLLQEALQRREHLHFVLPILADIGSRRLEPEIRELSRDRDPRVAKAADDALRLLAAQR